MTEDTTPLTLPTINGHDPTSALLTPEQRAKKQARERAYYARNKEQMNARDRAEYARNKEQYQARNAARAAYKREWYLANLERIKAQKSNPEARTKKNEARNAKRRTDPEYRARDQARARASYERHKEQRIKQAREYYAQTKEEQRATRKQYYQTHKEDFYRRRDEWVAKNPEKKKASSYAWLERNREQQREKQISRLGITYEAYLEKLAEQHGVCAICKNPERMTVKKTGRMQYLCVDHDHQTGNIRGLLCGRCNIAIGMLGDEPATVFSAWEYLIKHAGEEE